eukprot:6178712-Pleurochrysis_carterae.AAC.1
MGARRPVLSGLRKRPMEPLTSERAEKTARSVLSRGAVGAQSAARAGKGAGKAGAAKPKPKARRRGDSDEDSMSEEESEEESEESELGESEGDEVSEEEGGEASDEDVEEGEGVGQGVVDKGRMVSAAFAAGVAGTSACAGEAETAETAATVEERAAETHTSAAAMLTSLRHGRAGSAPLAASARAAPDSRAPQLGYHDDDDRHHHHHHEAEGWVTNRDQHEGAPCSSVSSQSLSGGDASSEGARGGRAKLKLSKPKKHCYEHSL